MEPGDLIGEVFVGSGCGGSGTVESVWGSGSLCSTENEFFVSIFPSGLKVS